MDEHVERLLPIGRFGNLCGLSAVTLRHYAETGILEPARIDPSSGYRYYAPSQVRAASTVKLLRGLGFSLAQVAALLEADPETTRSLLAAHLVQLEQQHVSRTLMSTYILSRLIPEENAVSFPVRTQAEPVRVVLMRTKHLAIAELGPFLDQAFTELSAQAAERGMPAPPGASFTRFHGPVDEEHTGTVDACLTVDVPGGTAGTTTLEAVLAAATDARGEDASYPRLLSAYDAVAYWAGTHGHDLIEPAREYYRSRRASGDAEDHIEVVWPIST